MSDLTTKPPTATFQKTGEVTADAAPAPAATASIISSDIEISGNVETSGDVHIDGVIQGDVRAVKLTVGEAGKIFGEVAATQVVVNGAVKGRIVGDDVELKPSAMVQGDIAQTTLEVRRGAQFEGSVKRRAEPKPAPPPKPTSKPAASPAPETAAPKEA